MSRSAPDPFHEFVRELFAPMGPFSIRRMFGGAGAFADNVMFLLLSDDVIYLKVDDALLAALVEQGGAPFTWARPSDGKEMQMPYVSLPSDALDDPELASEWGRKALSVALAAAKSKPKKRRKKA